VPTIALDTPGWLSVKRRMNSWRLMPSSSRSSSLAACQRSWAAGPEELSGCTVQFLSCLGEALQTPVLQEVISSAYAPVVSAVGELVAACAADGSMGEGMNPEDVLLMMSFMTRVESTPAAAARADRAMELAINGLRQP
jgi:hypothetical protein